jgi:hypothetical protein
MVTALEADMPQVFEKIGQVDAAVGATRLVHYVIRRGGCPCQEGNRHVWSNFPNQREYQEVVNGLVTSGQLVVKTNGSTMWFFPGPTATRATPGTGSKSTSEAPHPSSSLLDQRNRRSVPDILSRSSTLRASISPPFHSYSLWASFSIVEGLARSPTRTWAAALARSRWAASLP